MTEKTLNYLRTRVAEIDERILELTTGESGHQRAAYHDDAGGQNDLNNLRGLRTQIGNLRGVSIIEPREKTDDVGMGNRIKVLYEGEEEPEMFYLLGRDDAANEGNWVNGVISNQSPLGQAIVGKLAGDTVIVETPENSVSVRIIDIFPGDFE